MKAPFFATPYNYDAAKVSDETGLKCLDVSLTDQSMADEADINTIVKRFGLTGQLPSNVRVPLFEDFDEVFDYRTALEAIRQSEASFRTMPADVRARFQNDPGLFVDFCTAVKDGQLANLEEMRKLGLAVEAVKPPVVPPVVTP